MKTLLTVSIAVLTLAIAASTHARYTATATRSTASFKTASGRNGVSQQGTSLQGPRAHGTPVGDLIGSAIPVCVSPAYRRRRGRELNYKWVWVRIAYPNRSPSRDGRLAHFISPPTQSDHTVSRTKFVIGCYLAATGTQAVTERPRHMKPQ
jgi:hypothetical protein